MIHEAQLFSYLRKNASSCTVVGLEAGHRHRRTSNTVDRAPYLILGACNVVLREEGAETIVEAMDPMAALGIAHSTAIHPVAEEARARLQREIAAGGE